MASQGRSGGVIVGCGPCAKARRAMPAPMRKVIENFERGMIERRSKKKSDKVSEGR